MVLANPAAATATPYGPARIRGTAGGHTLVAHMLSP
jgi:hypothetical protein